MIHKLSLFCMIVVFVVGCDESDHACSSGSSTVAEGIIWSVEYELGDGTSTGLARLQSGAGLPSGGGTSNVDAYGKLTTQFLFINFPKRTDIEQFIIPVNRLVSIRFGDGGIKTIE